MLGWFQLLQLGFALFVVVLIAGRVHELCWRAPISDALARWLVDALVARDIEAVRAFCAERPDSHAARLAAHTLQDVQQADTDSGELLADLYEEAGARLLALRVSATLASTTGLLGGILALARDSQQSAGLLALKAGAAAHHNLSQAIFTMALGVALSAVCFQALALLRPAAQRLVTQDATVARACIHGTAQAA